jgi:hypothetical protein
MDAAVVESIPITGRENDGRWSADVESMPGVIDFGETREKVGPYLVHVPLGRVLSIA